jgi:hypothetical protein
MSSRIPPSREFVRTDRRLGDRIAGLAAIAAALASGLTLNVASGDLTLNVASGDLTLSGETRRDARLRFAPVIR